MKRAVLCLCAALAACAGPPPGPPTMAPVEAYTPGPVQEERLVPGQDIPAQWWGLFRSPKLDAVVRQALADSPTLAQAQARLRQAQEGLSARSGSAQLPRVDAKLSANRVDVNPESLGVPALPVPMPLDLYLASISVSYTFDFFGAVRNELEGLRAEVDAQRYEVEAARLMLAGNVVTTAIREAALREQIGATEEMLALQARQLAVAERLQQLGGVSSAELVRQQREFAQARAELPTLRRDLAQMRHRLAVYVGQAPGGPALPEFRLADLQRPATLPLSLPSELARQRPDVRVAEAMLAEAGARLGVATANLYPQITLTAQGGSLAAAAGDLFGPGTGFYMLGASLVQPLFRGGELQARRRASVAAYDQASAAYRETVLRGLQNVADTLRALESDAARLKERSEAVALAQRFRDITLQRQAAGGVSELAVLDAQRQYQRTVLEQAGAIADQHADSAALLQALGGGWWNRGASDVGVGKP